MVAPPKHLTDVATGTDIFQKKEESCQTESQIKKDFQSYFNQQGQPVATQTCNLSKCDFQAQANIQRESVSIALQTIKEEIAMPNLPNSVGQTQSKKRKLSTNSSVCTTPINIDSNNIHSARQTIPNGSGDQSNNEHSDGILNSEVYKIYCRHSNPKEAMEEIKK